MAPSPVGSTAARRSKLVSVSRQPIFQSDFEVYGYELFFDREPEQRHTNGDRKERSSEALVDFTQRELGNAVGIHRAFINLTQSVILSGSCDRMPAERVVLEVLENVEPEPKVIAELQRLSKRGYRIALDDFVYKPSQVPLVQLADIVKIDLLATRSDVLKDVVGVLRSFDVQLLAEKIETEDDLQLARDLKFDYFQGFFLGRPSSEW